MTTNDFEKLNTYLMAFAGEDAEKNIFISNFMKVLSEAEVANLDEIVNGIFEYSFPVQCIFGKFGTLGFSFEQLRLFYDNFNIVSAPVKEAVYSMRFSVDGGNVPLCGIFENAKDSTRNSGMYLIPKIGFSYTPSSSTFSSVFDLISYLPESFIEDACAEIDLDEFENVELRNFMSKLKYSVYTDEDDQNHVNLEDCFLIKIDNISKERELLEAFARLDFSPIDFPNNVHGFIEANVFKPEIGKSFDRLCKKVAIYEASKNFSDVISVTDEYFANVEFDSVNATIDNFYDVFLEAYGAALKGNISYIAGFYAYLQELKQAKEYIDAFYSAAESDSHFERGV